MIQFENIHKTYGKAPVLNGLTCQIDAGQVTLLIGSNGAGKSTALKIAAGLIAADSGTVTVAGWDMAKQPGKALAHLGFLPQNTGFHPRLKVREVLRFYANARGASKCRMEAELERWGLAEHAHKETQHLSGGLRQRLGLAVLMLPDVPVLALDEPGVSLDPEWRSRMQEIFIAEARRGKAIVAATHLMGEWEGRADRCLLCKDGRVSQVVDPARLRDSTPHILELAAI